ncbi:hypothetical protein M8C21_020480 [Ambrosia artemisiifolia]|uniref:Uncharacterized protein n=1 Tax=Ambrosia artemisiifolia TaxID=4212 RepID=A0AAD5GLY8_AMBAR|nr:hypothetical protein M8C21_020480 [Ambrosia artemisiifolia]
MIKTDNYLLLLKLMNPLLNHITTYQKMK